MGRITETFRRLRAAGERALVPFVTAGDPDLASTEEVVLAMLEAGADLVELGVPFSDPMADGPTIQRASQRALSGGVTLRGVLASVKRLRGHTEAPILLMGYANPFYAMGVEGFVAAALDVGVDGIIVPDLPPEEGADLFGEAERRGLDAVLLAAPTTRPARLAMLVEQTRGFLYCVSLTGVTGARRELAAGIEDAVRAVRARSEIPVCVGFGIATPEHAAAVGHYADGVVVGGALIDRLEAVSGRDARAEAAARFVAEMKAPLRRSGP
jgi:tryptophan synthase alpha chain